MDMYLIRFRDTGYIPICANSLTLNGRGGTRCESARDLEDAGGPGRNERGCRYMIPGHEYTNPEYCTVTHPELEVIQADPGEEWVWINFIHSGAHHSLAISIDEHEFWIVGADGEFVHPQKVVRTHVNLGERTSILVKLDKPAGDYALRLHSLRSEQMIQGAGILRYAATKDLSKTSNRTVPNTKPWLHLNGSLVDPANKVMEETKLSPFPPRPPPQKADFTLKFTVNNTGPSTWVLNAAPHEFFRQNVPPILWNEKSRGKTSWGNPHGFLKNGSVVDLIIENGAKVDASHPFHKHNHKVFIIGQGQGGFPWKDVDDAIKHGGGKYFNLDNPPYRDGFTLQAGEGKFVVVRYKIYFPAVSMLHCHMIHHFASGQQVILLEGMEVMPPVPEELKNKPHVEFQMPPRHILFESAVMSVVTLNDPRVKYQTATLNGVEYNYILAEPASGNVVGTIFLIHGWPDMSLGWRNQIPYLLSKGLRVVAPDMMGYGGTDAPEDVSFYTFKRASDDIAALASHLGLSRIILGGHDWGGAVVYRAALWYPELISAFFVISTPFAAPRLTYIDQAVALPTLHYQQQFRTDAVQDYIGLPDAQNATRVRQILNTIYGVRLPSGGSAFNSSGAGFTFELLDEVTEDTPLLTAEEMDYYVENYVSDPFNRTLNWYRTGELNWQDELALVPANASYTAKYTQPALYIGGSLDTALPPVLSTGMETYFNSLSRGEVNGTHWVMWEKPEDVNSYVGNWLASSVLGNVTIGLNLTAASALLH
ncbi:Laccase abr2 [Colletotrichum sp. SAR11_240]|nr:Laccase abr2 [Colletotrichum sp. SAR11_240]